MSSEHRSAASSRSSRDDEENLSPSPGVLFHEKLPGPLYGLPALPAHSCTRPVADEDLNSQREKFELEQLSRSAIWNADLPIHRLPSEVLLHVFEHQIVSVFPTETVPPQKSRLSATPDRSRMFLMGVCRHWCALIRNTGRFWSDIVVTQRTSHARIDLALRRAGSAPIRVEIASNREIPRVLTKLTKHTDHIELFRFSGHLRDGPDTLALNSFLASHSFPILNHLTVVLPQLVSPTAVHALTGTCIRLRVLSLTRMTLSWTESIFANLEVLSLANCQLSEPRISFTDFLDLLELGQRLRYVRLEHFLATLHSQPSMLHQRIRTLPHLHHFVCHDVPLYVASLVTHLHTPSIMELNLVGKCSGADDPSATYSSLLPSLPVLALITSVSLTICDGENRIHTSGSPLTLRLSLRAPGAAWGTLIDRCLRDLPVLFTPTLTRLKIHGPLDEVSSATWDFVFDSFPALEEFATHVHDGYDRSTAAICSLAAPVAHSSDPGSGAGDSGVHAVRCRNLKRLSVDGAMSDGTFLDKVLECLRFRATCGARKLDHVRIKIDYLGDPEEDIAEYRERFRAFADLVTLLLFTW